MLRSFKNYFQGPAQQEIVSQSKKSQSYTLKFKLNQSGHEVHLSIPSLENIEKSDNQANMSQFLREAGLTSEQVIQVENFNQDQKQFIVDEFRKIMGYDLKISLEFIENLLQSNTYSLYDIERLRQWVGKLGAHNDIQKIMTKSNIENLLTNLSSECKHSKYHKDHSKQVIILNIFVELIESDNAALQLLSGIESSAIIISQSFNMLHPELTYLVLKIFEQFFHKDKDQLQTVMNALVNYQECNALQNPLDFLIQILKESTNVFYVYIVIQFLSQFIQASKQYNKKLLEVFEQIQFADAMKYLEKRTMKCEYLPSNCYYENAMDQLIIFDDNSEEMFIFDKHSNPNIKFEKEFPMVLDRQSRQKCFLDTNVKDLDDTNILVELKNEIDRVKLELNIEYAMSEEGSSDYIEFSSEEEDKVMEIQPENQPENPRSPNLMRYNRLYESEQPYRMTESNLLKQQLQEVKINLRGKQQDNYDLMIKFQKLQEENDALLKMVDRMNQQKKEDILNQQDIAQDFQQKTKQNQNKMSSSNNQTKILNPVCQEFDEQKNLIPNYKKIAKIDLQDNRIDRLSQSVFVQTPKLKKRDPDHAISQIATQPQQSSQLEDLISPSYESPIALSSAQFSDPTKITSVSVEGSEPNQINHLHQLPQESIKQIGSTSTSPPPPPPPSPSLPQQQIQLTDIITPPPPPPPPPTPHQNQHITSQIGIPKPPPPPPPQQQTYQHGMPPPPPPPNSNFNPQTVQNTKKKHISSIPTKTVQWAVLTKVQNTLWDKVNEIKVDTHEIEEIFRAKPKTTKQTKMVIEEKKLLSRLDSTKQNSIHIVLKSLRLSTSVLINALIQIDQSILTDNNIDQLEQALPKDKELTLWEDKPDMSRFMACDVFCVEIQKVIGFEHRIYALKFEYEFKGKCDLLNLKSAIYLKLFKQIRNDINLQTCLQYILEVGNILNGTTARGGTKIMNMKGAFGITLDSLNKLECKSDYYPQMNLLMYVVREVEKQQQIDIVDLNENLADLEGMSYLKFDDLDHIFKTIKSGLNTVQLAIKSQSDNPLDNCREHFTELAQNISSFIKHHEDQLKQIDKEKELTLNYFGSQSKTHEEFFKIIYTFKLNLKNAKTKVNQNENMKKLLKEQEKKDEMSQLVEKKLTESKMFKRNNKSTSINKSTF